MNHLSGTTIRLGARYQKGSLRWAFDLVAIPSPTGDSQAAAEYYADRLRELGAEVRFDEDIPGSPSVIAYVNGAHPGPTLELAGHLDVIPVEQDAPYHPGRRALRPRRVRHEGADGGCAGGYACCLLQPCVIGCMAG